MCLKLMKIWLICALCIHTLCKNKPAPHLWKRVLFYSPNTWIVKNSILNWANTTLDKMLISYFSIMLYILMIIILLLGFLFLIFSLFFSITFSISSILLRVLTFIRCGFEQTENYEQPFWMFVYYYMNTILPCE